MVAKVAAQEWLQTRDRIACKRFERLKVRGEQGRRRETREAEI